MDPDLHSTYSGMQGDIAPIGFQQVLMASLGYHATSLKHYDMIHPIQINKPVGNHQECSPCGQLPQCLHQAAFRNSVQPFRRFIHHPNRCIMKDGPGNGYPPNLTSG